MPLANNTNLFFNTLLAKESIRWRAITENSRGAAVIETALTISLLLFIVLAGIDLLLAFYRLAAVHFALADNVRKAAIFDRTTNQYQSIPQIKDLLVQKLAVLGVDIESPATAIRVCPGVEPTACITEELGDPGQLFVVSLDLPLGYLIFPAVTVNHSVIGRKEYRPPSIVCP